ncbi:uncharacterized protein LOC128709776 [Anopheles marshallii]|uniref:uncharacterized protein LOC128709776 n=1 Tax=Anopheles marshallii TaxID=1521116 RepID=UPI00237A7E86|nr:uncharacterized protein LOC128709776 [Anopheles marshallii]
MSLDCVLTFLLLLTGTFGNYTDTLWEHRCDPGSEIFVCTVPNFLYRPNQNHSKLIVPETVRKVRLAYPTDKILIQRDTIVAYDATLHAALHRPKAVQIAGTMLKRFEVPLDLEYADFRDNSIHTVLAPEVNGSVYALRYLDLRNNEMERIDSLATLVNLETLMLRANRISVLDGTALGCFTKLTGLDLGSNTVEEIPASHLPASLEWLILRRNMLYASVDFSGARLPALKVLDMQHNFCNELDLGVLLVAAPNLDGIMLDGNFINSEEGKVIMTRLVNAGVSHDKFVMSDSEHDDEQNDYYRRQQKIKVQEDIIAGMIAVVNVCVIGWGFYRVYKSRISIVTERASGSTV